MAQYSAFSELPTHVQVQMAANSNMASDFKMTACSSMAEFEMDSNRPNLSVSSCVPSDINMAASFTVSTDFKMATTESSMTNNYNIADHSNMPPTFKMAPDFNLTVEPFSHFKRNSDDTFPEIKMAASSNMATDFKMGTECNMAPAFMMAPDFSLSVEPFSSRKRMADSSIEEHNRKKIQLSTMANFSGSFLDSPNTMAENSSYLPSPLDLSLKSSNFQPYYDDSINDSPLDLSMKRPITSTAVKPKARKSLVFYSPEKNSSFELKRKSQDFARFSMEDELPSVFSPLKPMDPFSLYSRYTLSTSDGCSPEVMKLDENAVMDWNSFRASETSQDKYRTPVERHKYYGFTAISPLTTDRSSGLEDNSSESENRNDPCDLEESCTLERRKCNVGSNQDENCNVVCSELEESRNEASEVMNQNHSVPSEECEETHNDAPSKHCNISGEVMSESPHVHSREENENCIVLSDQWEVVSRKPSENHNNHSGKMEHNQNIPSDQTENRSHVSFQDSVENHYGVSKTPEKNHNVPYKALEVKCNTLDGKLEENHNLEEKKLDQTGFEEPADEHNEPASSRRMALNIDRNFSVSDNKQSYIDGIDNMHTEGEQNICTVNIPEKNEKFEDLGVNNTVQINKDEEQNSGKQGSNALFKQTCPTEENHGNIEQSNNAVFKHIYPREENNGNIEQRSSASCKHDCYCEEQRDKPKQRGDTSQEEESPKEETEKHQEEKTYATLRNLELSTNDYVCGGCSRNFTCEGDLVGHFIYCRLLHMELKPPLSPFLTHDFEKPMNLNELKMEIHEKPINMYIQNPEMFENPLNVKAIKMEVPQKLNMDVWNQEMPEKPLNMHVQNQDMPQKPMSMHVQHQELPPESAIRNVPTPKMFVKPVNVNILNQKMPEKAVNVNVLDQGMSQKLINMNTLKTEKPGNTMNVNTLKTEMPGNTMNMNEQNPEKVHKLEIPVTDKLNIAKSYESSSEGFNCRWCSKAFKKQFRVRRHERMVHCKERPHICPYCSKAFAQSSDLRKHKVSIHKMVLCTICHKVFADENEKQTHCSATHQNFTCEICNMVFVSDFKLACHLQLFHGKVISAPKTCAEMHGHEIKVKEEVDGKVKEEPGSKCDDNAEIGKPATPEDDTLSYNPLVIVENPSDLIVIRYQCPSCPNNYKTSGELKKHQMSHISTFKVYTCTLCDKHFKRSSNLRQHEGTFLHLTNVSKQKEHQQVEERERSDEGEAGSKVDM